jgi:PAS domain-containing protein
LTASVHRELDARRGAEERYRLLFESSPSPMFVFDAETHRFLAVNDAAVAAYGYSRDEFLGLVIEDIRPPEEVVRLPASATSVPGATAARTAPTSRSRSARTTISSRDEPPAS